jgi:multiple sugar transport system substrate-binding protein
MWKRLNKGLFIGAVIVSLFSWVANGKTVLTHLTYPNHGEPWQEFVRSQALAFERANPDIKIDLVVGSGVSKFMTMVAGGVAPDITEFALVYGGTLAADGHFLDLRPFFARDRQVNLNHYAPIAIQAMTASDGAMWGFPADVYPASTYYDVDFFADAGLLTPSELGENWTWDTMLQAAKKLTRDTNRDGVVDFWGIGGGSGMWDHMAFVRQAGGTLYDRYVDPTESRLNEPAVERAMQWYADLYLTHGVIYNGWDGMTKRIAAMSLVSGPTAIESMQAAGVRVDVAPQPKGPANRGAYVAQNGFQIVESTKHPELAWEWVKFLIGTDEAISQFAQVTTRFPANMRVARRYRDFIDNPPPNIAAVLETAVDPASFHLPIGKNTSETRSILSSIRGPIVQGSLGVRMALEDAHRRINALLKGER